MTLGVPPESDEEKLARMARQCLFANNHDRLMRLSELRKTMRRLEEELQTTKDEYSDIIHVLKQPRTTQSAQ